MRSSREIRRRSVFLNVPFDEDYERLFVALISALVALGRIPHCVLELPETGQGRLLRILQLISSCPVSIHDLSRAELPARFNMPFMFPRETVPSKVLIGNAILNIATCASSPLSADIRFVSVRPGAVRTC